MKEFLNQIDKDIKRCEDVLKENNYLEIVIAVEELVDKYKETIKEIKVENERVWNYSKKDLEKLQERLKIYRNEHIFELMLSNIIKELRQNEEISLQKLNEVEGVLRDIEKIYNSHDSLNNKWNKLRGYLCYASEESVVVASNIIAIINIILKIEQHK